MQKDWILEKANKRYSAYSANAYFCVFRVGEKYKYGTTTSKGGMISYNNINSISYYEMHMERDMEVPNADPTLSKMNKVLIGNHNVTDKVQDYLKGVKPRKNSIIARDLVLTTSPGFFEHMVENEKKIWYEENVKFLKEEFGSNCVYACLHMDETTPHIHALIVPKFYNEKKNIYELKNNVYFDGKEKLREWQDKYANYMSQRFNNLIRGVRGSRAKHIDIKTYYSTINKQLETCTPKEAEAIVKNNYLLKKRIVALEDTLKANEKKQMSIESLMNRLEKVEHNNKVFKKTLRDISKEFGIPEKKLLAMIDKNNKGNTKDRGKERER